MPQKTNCYCPDKIAFTYAYLDPVLDLRLLLMFCCYQRMVLSVGGLLVGSDNFFSEVRRLVTEVADADLLFLVVVVGMAAWVEAK